MIRRVVVGVLLAASMVIGPVAASAVYAYDLDESGINWRYGFTIRGTECWSKPILRDGIRLEIKKAGKWQPLTTGKVSIDRGKCSDAKLPVKVKWAVPVDHLGRALPDGYFLNEYRYVSGDFKRGFTRKINPD